MGNPSASGHTQRRRGLRLIVLLAVAAADLASAMPASANDPIKPDPPVLLSPAPGFATSENVVFRWAAAPRALSYEVKVQPLPSGASCGGGTVALSLTCDELPPGTYAWSVRSTGLDSINSDYSVGQTFVKLARPFTAPSLLSPGSGTTFNYPEDTGVLRWSTVPNAAGYELHISADPGFVGPDVLTSASGVEAAFAPATYFGVTQYWRVRAVTSPGVAAGPWSAVRSFVVNWDTPQLLTPPDGATRSTVVLTWQPLPGAQFYLIEIDEDPAFGSPIFTDPHATSMDLGDYLVDGTWHWRVRGVSADFHESPWAVGTFVVDAGGPASPPAPPVPALEAPILLAPSDGASGFVPQRDFVDWAPVDETLGYDLQIVPQTDAFPDDPGGPDLTRTQAVPNLDAGVTYKWRVRANRSHGIFDAGPWSEVRTFSTVPLSTVTLTGPADGATRSIEDAEFTWEALPDWPVYRVELSQTLDFASPIGFRVVATPLAVLRNKLAMGTWYWRVVAGRDNRMAISETRALTIADLSPPVGRIGYPPDYSLLDEFTLGYEAEDMATTWVIKAAASANGVDWLEFDFDSPPLWSLVSPEHGGPDPGLRHLYMKWRDAAGNWSEPAHHSFWYGVPDPAPPAGNVVIEAGAARVTTTSVWLDVTATDIDPVLKVALSNNGVTWTERTYAPTQSWTLPSGDGAHTVYAKWMDLVGHWSAVDSDSVILDTQPPTGSVEILDDHGFTPISDVTIRVHASDTTSAVTDVALSNDGVTWTNRPLSTPQSWTLAPGEGTRTVWAKFRDEVGHWSAPVSDSTVVDLGAVVSRQWGPNRYATAAAISEATFAAHVPVVFIANGSSFPDALSAAAAAGHAGGPLLLVTATSIPPETAAELLRLQPGAIVVAGGTGVVSSAVASALDAYTAGSVTRLAGANRYATSAAMSAGSFDPGVPVAYVATGSNFPDALAAAAAAGHLDGPLLLVTASSIPPEVAAELSRLKPARIVIAGGTAVVGNAVMAALDAYTTGPVTRQSGPNRYATAAAISASTFGPPAPVVYVATGLNFPDALAAAAAAGYLGGPLLLVTADSIPSETFSELERLNPVRIIVAGGVSVVGSHVQADLGSF